MFQVENSPESVLVRVFGELDEEGVPKLEEVVTTLAPRNSLVIDLTGCKYINSQGISVLVRLQRQFGDDFEVIIPQSGAVYKVFEICGFLGTKTFVRVAHGADKLSEATGD